MKQYRLKKEAVPFFIEKHATAIYPLDTWKSIAVDINALEEVEETFLTFGHPTSKSTKSLCGWSGDNGAYFHFTIHFPGVKYSEHDKFSNGKVTRELMNKIQNSINTFYADFLNNE